MANALTKKSQTINVSRHKIRFRVSRESAALETAVQEVQVLVRAKNGWTTKAIASDLGLTESQVSYRIKKGESIGDRAAFRSGATWVSQLALKATAEEIIHQVAKTVSKKYL